MCGIVGYFETAVLNAADLEKMRDAIAHRGPDGFGAKAWRRTALGHRRLAILDLSDQAAQPMTYCGSGLWIAHNGEIYNYLELREELRGLGYTFQSSSDTEVVLAAFERWGPGAFQRFNGMWAFALFDEKKNQLTLSVDRFGVKPLYYAECSDGGIAFASELKALLAVADRLNLRWDEAGVRTALTTPMGLEASGRTVLKGVRALAGGETLEAAPGRHRIFSWWNTAEHLRSQVPATFEEQAEEFRDLLMDATRIRLRSDVPIATSLSGGLDSSSIVGLLRHLGAGGQTAFVHAFDGTAHDESDYARKIIAHAKVPVQWVRADSKSLPEHIDSWIYGFESIFPGAPDSAWRIYHEQKKSGFSVTIDGHGADEYLAGYSRYLPFVQPWWRIQPLKDSLGSFFSWKQVLAGAFRPLLEKRAANNPFLRLARRVNDPLLSALRPGFLFGSIYDSKPLELPDAGFERSPLNVALYFDFHRRILPRILRNFDLVSMANGIEVRMPFMDYRLVTYAFSLPATSKIRNGMSKAILRESSQTWIPEEIRIRKSKVGFNSPLGEWLQGPLREWAEDSLRRPSPLDAHVDSKKLATLYRKRVLQHPDRWADASSFWKILTARHWMRQLESRNGVRW